jgi:F-type H+-transporting ATPase subunit gamma
MPSLRDIRRRIRSVRNTAQITKAMELVAASRMRRAQLRVTQARPYSTAMRTMIAQLGAARSEGGALHPLLQERPVRNVGLVMLTTDRGLCGPLNTNVIRRGTEFLLSQDSHEVELVTVGRKGQDFMSRRGRALRATFTALGDRPDYMAIVPIARVVMDDFERGAIDAAYVLFPRFISTLNQRPQLDQLLPITPPTEDGDGAARVDYIYEPDPGAILDELLPRYVEVQIYQAVLETIASEQSARMIAMRNANDSAKDLIAGLTLSYNKARQAAITREVTEIASAAEAMAHRE